MRLEQSPSQEPGEEMSTSEIDSILTKVERLSADDKRLLIKRVVDLLGKTKARRKGRRILQTNRGEKAEVQTAKRRSALDKSIAAYAARHGGGSDGVDLDPAIEKASLEAWLDEG